MGYSNGIIARFNSYKKIDYCLLLVLLAATVLHLIHFFFRTSMWFDELTSALNIRDKSFYHLATQSLDYNQVAPVGFILLEKIEMKYLASKGMSVLRSLKAGNSIAKTFKR